MDDAAGEQGTDECTVEIFKGKGTATGKVVVIASDNGSASVVANKVENIAGEICRQMRIKPENLVFIEHRREQPNFEETFDLVHLQYHAASKKFIKPEWSAFTKEATDKITGDQIKQIKQ